MNHLINQLIAYGLNEGLLSKDDKEYAVNQLLYLFHLSSYSEEVLTEPIEIYELLDQLLEAAFNQGLIPSKSISDFDHFEAKMMDALLPRPSEMNKRFRELYKKAPVYATNDFYHLSQKTNYIKTKRIEKNIHFDYNGAYAPLKISINLSKPEKDPMLIAKMHHQTDSHYPKCALCMENVGFYGDDFHASRSNHRVINLTLNHDKDGWGLQYSPYSYFNEHLIVLKKQHIPMKVDQQTFEELIDFVNQFPHYLIGSNAGLKIVGGSILSHYHFQGGNADFPIQHAKILREYKVGRMRVEVLDWPMSVIRIVGKDEYKIIDLVNQIFESWKDYSNPDLNIFAYTDEPHNTITPIVNIQDGYYHFYIVLRNNYTTKERPFGLFHPRDEYFHIKKENIGLIEVMGLAILPGRLKDELEEIKSYLLSKDKMPLSESLNKHQPWIEKLSQSTYQEDTIDQVLQNEVGSIFEKVLEDCGVFKAESRAEFYRFVEKSI
ncbi:MAG: galactose-1-phosphate uridylyltransferase [Candidatus Izemoplasmatales bacterium]